MAHNTMERVTLRAPALLVERVEALVETGEYPNRSEVFRDGVRDLLGKYDFDRDVPRRHPSDQPPTPQMVVTESGRSMTDENALAYQRVYALRSLKNGDEPFIVFDAGGLLDARQLPDDVVVARDAGELREAIGGI